MDGARFYLIPLLVLVGFFALMRGVKPEIDRPLPLPPLPLADAAGRPITLEAKPYLVNIYMPACAPCAREVPGLIAAQERYEADGVGFLAVSISPDRAWTETSVRRWGFSLPQAFTTDNLLALVEVNEVPTTLLISAEGHLIGLAEGERDAEWMMEAAGRLAALD